MPHYGAKLCLLKLNQGLIWKKRGAQTSFLESHNVSSRVWSSKKNPLFPNLTLGRWIDPPHTPFHCQSYTRSNLVINPTRWSFSFTIGPRYRSLYFTIWWLHKCKEVWWPDRRNACTWFPEIGAILRGGGRGSTAVWNLSENSSYLVAWPVPF